MRFEATRKETTFLNPMENMAPTTVPTEIRTDPLTGRTSRICHFRLMKWPNPNFHELAPGTEATCPFCPDKVMVLTPSFPQDLLPEGRLVEGDMVLVPNIAPYDEISALTILGSTHFLGMQDISAETIARGFRLSFDFFNRLKQTGHSEAIYFMINWNFMPASGSSVLHPHFQVFASSTAPNIMREELIAARKYMDEKGTNYWDDLVEAEEKDGARYLGRIGRTVWLSSYAPMGVAGDVMGIVENASHTLELTMEDLDSLAQGLVKAVKGWDEMGLGSFNMNFFTGAEGDDHYRFHVLASPRSYFNQKLGTPDVGALRNLYNESMCMAFPEEINEKLKQFF